MQTMDIEQLIANLTPAERMLLRTVLAELRRARRLYPWWPDDPIHAAAIASEESGEVVKACNDLMHHPGKGIDEYDVRYEGVQAAAMALRFLFETPAFANLARLEAKPAEKEPTG